MTSINNLNNFSTEDLVNEIKKRNECHEILNNLSETDNSLCVIQDTIKRLDFVVLGEITTKQELKEDLQSQILSNLLYKKDNPQDIEDKVVDDYCEYINDQIVEEFYQGNDLISEFLEINNDLV